MSTTPSGQPLPPIEQPRKRYTTFYLTLLILSTTGTVLSLFSWFELPKTIAYLSTDTLYAVASLVSMLVGLPLSIAGLVLLWCKHRAGIWVKLSAYGVTILTGIMTAFTAENVVQKKLMQELSNQPVSGMGESTLLAIANAGFYVATGMGIVMAITFGLLWWFAYRAQVREDAE